MKQFLRIQIIVLCLWLLPVFWVAGESSLNALCYVQDSSVEPIQGYRVNELFEIASVSKVVTSYWAIKKLGPHFRFETKVHIKMVGDKIFDVHIQGSQDPFWGRQLTHFLFSELNRLGVREIRSITFDENFKMRWKVLSDFVEIRNPSTNEIKVSIENHLANLEREYADTWAEAVNAKIGLPQQVFLRAKEVRFLSASEFYPDLENTRSFALKSAPLFRYVKAMNRVSNNHVADKLYDYLGGTEAFASFIFENLNPADVHFVNGSGNAVVIGYDKNGREVKEYNRASCKAIVSTLRLLQQDLKLDGNLDLKDVMAVSSSDESTLTPGYSTIPNSLVAKTGTVDSAVAISGLAVTNQSDIYFGVFYRTRGPAEWSAARRRVREYVFDFFTRFGGAKTVVYSPQVFLPFDEKSGLKGVSHSEP
ncbi:MAG: D-alanyl-D-alanine carboxypeptidase [Bdellovibrionaceae bacterium]|nr:D-alanyl-D-alanine carboxypeptidase [Pseudobdellovibrionaceae bacterium]